MELGKDDFLEEFGDVGEEGNSTIVGWVSLIFFGVFRYWCNVTELEDCRDVASGDYHGCRRQILSVEVMLHHAKRGGEKT